MVRKLAGWTVLLVYMSAARPVGIENILVKKLLAPEMKFIENHLMPALKLLSIGAITNVSPEPL